MGVVADLADRVAVMYRGELVETAPVKELFASPQEEYTQALLAAVPRLGADSRSGPGGMGTAAAARAGGGAAEVGETTAAEAGEPAAAGRPADAGGATETAAVAEAVGTFGEPVVTARGLEIVYPGGIGKPDFTAVAGVDFTVHKGEVFGLVGESGSGKTTIGRAIAGLTTATGGSLNVLGYEMVGMKEKTFKPLRKRIGFVFQDPAASFNPQLTVGQCIEEPFAVHRPKMSDAEQAEGSAVTAGRRPAAHRVCEAISARAVRWSASARVFGTRHRAGSGAAGGR